MAETTFRFIYDSVAATTATSTAGGSTSGKSPTKEKPVDTGSPTRIAHLMKQSSKSVQEGIKGGLKSLGIALTLGNLLKQSQVFTSSLNALFQIVGAFFDILLAPLMPYFAKWLRRGAPKLIEWAEKMAKWMESLFLEIGSAESFGSWVGEKVAEGISKAVRKSLGMEDPDDKVPVDPRDMDTSIEKAGKGIMELFKAMFPMVHYTGKVGSMFGFFGGTDAYDAMYERPLGEGGGMPKNPIEDRFGAGLGGFFDTGLFSTDASFMKSLNEIGEFMGRGTSGARNWMTTILRDIDNQQFGIGNSGWAQRNLPHWMMNVLSYDATKRGDPANAPKTMQQHYEEQAGLGSMGGGIFDFPFLNWLFGSNNQTDVAGAKHNGELSAEQQKQWHLDNNGNAGTWADN